MSRKFLTPLLTALFLAAPAAFGPAVPPAFSGSAEAINLNSSRSNVYKTNTTGKKAGKTTGTTTGISEDGTMTSYRKKK